MSTQLEQISDLFLRDTVTEKEIVSYLDILISSSIDPQELESIRLKLLVSTPLTDSERGLLVEILKNMIELFRTYGKRCDALTQYIKTL